jgi:hypothetical protein
MLTLTGIGLVGLLTLGFPDVYLLTTAATVNVPFAGAASFKTTLIVLPILLIGVRVYLQVYVDHWRRLDQITRRFSARREPVLSPLRQPVLRLFAGFVLYAIVPLVTGVLAYEAMVVPRLGMTLLGLAIIVGYVQICPKDWPWSAKLVPLVLIVVTVIILIYEGKLNAVQRPFQLELADLERSNLTDQDMKSANLINANLRQAKLRDANLREAKLYGADLQKADLQSANLNKASLWLANLSGASFFCANLQLASLSEANLQGTIFLKANLSGADLRLTNVTQKQLNLACGDKNTQLPGGLKIKPCGRKVVTTECPIKTNKS